MLAPLLAVWLGPPPEAPPGSTDEQVIYEPAPAQPDALAPIEITPPPERSAPAERVPVVPIAPELEPEPELVQPAPPRSPPLPPPPPPPSGAGQFVGAGFSLALGIAALSVVGIEGTRVDPQRGVVLTFVPLSLAGLGIGTYLLARGVKVRRRFVEWRAYTGASVRPNGDGLLVAGVMSTVIGGVTLVAGAVQARDADGDIAVPITFGVGTAVLVTGIGTLTAGLMRRSRYRGWRQSTFLTSLPAVVPMRTGVAMSWQLVF